MAREMNPLLSLWTLTVGLKDNKTTNWQNLLGILTYIVLIFQRCLITGQTLLRCLGFTAQHGIGKQYLTSCPLKKVR